MGIVIPVMNAAASLSRKQMPLLISASVDPALCIIDCGGSAAEPHRGFLFDAGEDSLSVVRGFTVTGGEHDFAAGILCYHNDGDLLPGQPLGDGGAPSIVDCDVTGNTGNGVAAVGDTRGPLLKECRVDGNTGHGAYWAF